MEKVKVSVIVPNYNHAPYLKQRLASIFNQTFQNFEVILLDDASTDNSVEILEKYSTHPKVNHFVINDTNSGSTFKQWQKGIELAKGEFIWIAESDDWAESSFLEILLKQNFDILTAKSFVISENQTQIKPLEIDENLSMKGIDFIKKYMIYRNFLFNASAILFKKEKVDFSIFNIINDMKFLGDWVFWISLLRENSIFYNYRPLNYFNRHPNAASNKITKTGLFYFESSILIQYMKDVNILKGKKLWLQVWETWIGHYYNKHSIDQHSFKTLRFKLFYVIFLKHFNFYIFPAFLIKIYKKLICFNQ